MTTSEQAVALVRRELARKPDLIKIWFIRGPDVELEHAVKIVEAVVKASHAADVRVAVHATELETAKAAVGAGADILVHSVSDRPVDDEFVQMVKERRVIYTTTIVVLEGYAEVLGRNVDLTDIERSCGDAQVIASWADLAKIPEDLSRFPCDPERDRLTYTPTGGKDETARCGSQYNGTRRHYGGIVMYAPGNHRAGVRCRCDLRASA